MPNPWDAGTAKVLAWLGFEALATTSGGFATALGCRDGAVGREAVLAHAANIVDATELPVSADFENAYADDPDGVADTVRLGVQAGLAGCSVEDYTGRDEEPFYDLALAKERIAAAAEAAHGGPVRLVLTARAENWPFCDGARQTRSDLAAGARRSAARATRRTNPATRPRGPGRRDRHYALTDVPNPITQKMEAGRRLPCTYRR